MKIVEHLPFVKCYGCKDCVLSVKEQVLFLNGETQRQLHVRCRNYEPFCRQLFAAEEKERLKDA